jgi:serine/threonine-protein kinase
MKTIILMAMTVATMAAAQGKDLRGAYLYEAKLERVDFRGANLDKAQLSHADLRGADLRGANLKNAYLFKADLTGADLRGAQLPTAMKLTHVNLTGAKFDDATQLPFAKDEAVQRGMVQVDTAPEVELPAVRELKAVGEAV